jgi:hypothetical protein
MKLSCSLLGDYKSGDYSVPVCSVEVYSEDGGGIIVITQNTAVRRQLMSHP